jgi:hypothetical protein
MDFEGRKGRKGLMGLMGLVGLVGVSILETPTMSDIQDPVNLTSLPTSGENGMIQKTKF